MNRASAVPSDDCSGGTHRIRVKRHHLVAPSCGLRRSRRPVRAMGKPRVIPLVGGHAFTGGRRLAHVTGSEAIRDLEHLLRPCLSSGGRITEDGACVLLGCKFSPKSNKLMVQATRGSYLLACELRQTIPETTA
jgi:hypothetical protein